METKRHLEGEPRYCTHKSPRPQELQIRTTTGTPNIPSQGSPAAPLPSAPGCGGRRGPPAPLGCRPRVGPLHPPRPGRAPLPSREPPPPPGATRRRQRRRRRHGPRHGRRSLRWPGRPPRRCGAARRRRLVGRGERPWCTAAAAATTAAARVGSPARAQGQTPSWWHSR